MTKLVSGYSVITCTATGELLKEIDTINCGHCRRICHPEVGSVPGDNYGHCQRCDKDICANCATKMEAGAMCRTWEQNLTDLEAALERQLAVGEWGV